MDDEVATGIPKLRFSFPCLRGDLSADYAVKVWDRSGASVVGGGGRGKVGKGNAPQRGRASGGDHGSGPPSSPGGTAGLGTP